MVTCHLPHAYYLKHFTVMEGSFCTFSYFGGGPKDFSISLNHGQSFNVKCTKAPLTLVCHCETGLGH